MRLVYVSPTNYHTQYVTSITNDPNVPAGYILTSGSDGMADVPQQQYMAGINSGGFPSYTGDQTQKSVSSKWINGILQASGRVTL
jgi:hypothetical protein